MIKLDQAREEIKRQLRAYDGRAARLVTPIGKMDGLTWLATQPFSTKIYWADRHKKFKMCGVGAAVEICSTRAGFHDILEKLNTYLYDPSTRFYGGFKFDPNQSVPADWAQFGFYKFILPRFEIFTEHDKSFFVCNLAENDDIKDVEKQLDVLVQTPQPYTELASLNNGKTDYPIKSEWEDIIFRALDLFKNSSLQKIVLACQSDVEFTELVNPINLLHHIINGNHQTYNFCFQFDEHSAFMGVPPERLFYKEKNRVYSEAIAGTRPRLMDESLDHKMADELLHNEKEHREHTWVSEMIGRSLIPLCESLEIYEKERLLKLEHVQHLYTLFEGILKKETTTADLLEKLHPTPAVGGYPKNDAVQKIAELEPFDRGWYAGPIGWISKDSAEFAVAIRSALLNDKKLSIFAGSGIVEGSNAQKEWDENEVKKLNFTKILS